jgi:uncharacterized protein (TIGR00369 family)
VIPDKLLAPVKKFMEEQIPFNRMLGMQVTGLGEHWARLELPFREEFIGDPFRPALHGGVISTMLDTCGGAAVFTTMQSVKDRASTVDLRVDYLRPGRKETLVAEATIVRLGNRVAVVRLKAFHPGAEDEPIATGTGVYNVRRAQEKDSI